MRFRFMKEHSKEFSIGKMAKILKVSCSGYYSFLKRKIGIRNQENQRLTEEIRKIHTRFRRSYGSPRIHAELKEQGEKCSRKRVANLMKKAKIQAKINSKKKITTKPSGNHKNMPPNHLKQDFIVDLPN